MITITLPVWLLVAIVLLLTVQWILHWILAGARKKNTEAMESLNVTMARCILKQQVDK
jgi:tellurite resistance protein TehA-like permease